MKRILGTLAVAASLFAGVATTAQAAFVDTDATFITLTADVNIIDFRFAGRSASDTDEMRMVVGNSLIFVNQTTAVGDVISTGILGPGVYPLKLIDLTTPATWFSGPGAGNSDGAVHLKATTNFADFNLGAAPYSIPVGAFWYGWEDRPLPGPLSDFNDLVFSFNVRTGPNAIPEPSTYALMLAGLAMFGFMMRRRMN